MRTILIPIYNGLRARMFFYTDTFPELLKNGDIRLVIVAPTHKIEFYQKSFGRANVVFEGLDIMDEHWLGKRLVRIAFNLLPTTTVRGKQKLYYYRYGNYPKFLALRIANLILGPLPFIRELIRAIDRFVPLDARVVALLTKYKPEVAFIPDIIFGPDRIFARAARRKGIYIVGTPRSWDNLTSKGFAIIKPDKLLVLTSRMVPEAVKYVGMRKRDIVITGPPQFDAYFKHQQGTKEEFCKSLGIPANRRLILCAPFFDPYTGSAVAIINTLTGAISSGRLPSDLHVVVRYRPATPPIPEGQLNKSDHLTITQPCTLSFAVHDLVSPTEDFEWTQADVDLLINSLRFSSVVITTVSTLSIDAAAFDKPVITIRFDGDPNCPPRHSVSVMLPEHDHFKAIEASGGVRAVWSMDELLETVRSYADDPTIDAPSRKRLREQQIELLDGLAGKRIADFLKSAVNRAAGDALRYTEHNSEIF